MKDKIAGHHRFYIPPDYPDSNGDVRFSREESRHMISSLRVREGDLVTATDGRGNIYRLAVESTSGREVSARVRAVQRLEREGRPVDLFQAVIKPAKMELIVEKATELGLCGFTPVVSSRSERMAGRSRLVRLRKAAAEAMKQSLGAYLPDVRDPASFGEALEMMDDFDSVLVAWEGESVRALKRVLDGCRDGRIALWIGPAGGFTESEIALLGERGGVTFTLGRQRLKSETAAIASLAVLHHLLTP